MGVLAFPLSVFFSFLFCSTQTSMGTKVWVATREVTASGIPQVSNNFCCFFRFLFFLTILHIVQTFPGPKNLSVFSFCFLPIFDREFSFFFCFPPIFDSGFSLFLLLSFEAHSQVDSK